MMMTYIANAGILTKCDKSKHCKDEYTKWDINFLALQLTDKMTRVGFKEVQGRCKQKNLNYDYVFFVFLQSNEITAAHSFPRTPFMLLLHIDVHIPHIILYDRHETESDGFR